MSPRQISLGLLHFSKGGILTKLFQKLVTAVMALTAALAISATALADGALYLLK